METSELLQPHLEAVDGLRRVGNQFWTRGWSLGTSSNYSVLLSRDPVRILVTASGKDKGHLERTDFVIVDGNGRPVPEGQPKSSAETLLHCSAVLHRQAGSVLHTHSVHATILSEYFAQHHGIQLEGFEFLKGIEGIVTHESRLWLPIFENTQDIPVLQKQVEEYWSSKNDPFCYAYLIRRHGMYTWGRDLAAATRHMEVMEFLLECLYKKMSLK